MTTASAIVQRAIIDKMKLGYYITNADITALAAGSFTSPNRLARSHFSTNDFRESYSTIFSWEAATRADFFRGAGDLTPSTGVLAFDRNRADTTLGSENIFVIHHLDPQDVIDQLNVILEENRHRRLIPLSMATDPACFDSGTTAYVESDADGGAATTFTKSTTSPFWGPREGRVVNGAANGYVRVRFNVTTGARFYFGAITRVVTGSYEMGIHARADSVSAFTELGTAVGHSQFTNQYVSRRQDMTSTTMQMEVRHRAPGASDEFFFNGTWVYNLDQRMFVLPSFIDRRSKFKRLTQLHFVRTVSEGVEEGRGFHLTTIPDSAYDLHFSPADVAEGTIFFKDETYLNKPIVIEATRPYSDDGTISLPTDTTEMPLDLADPLLRYALIENHGSKIPNAAALGRMAEKDLKAAVRDQRDDEGPSERVRWSPRGVAW